MAELLSSQKKITSWTKLNYKRNTRLRLANWRVRNPKASLHSLRLYIRWLEECEESRFTSLEEAHGRDLVFARLWVWAARRGFRVLPEGL